MNTIVNKGSNRFEFFKRIVYSFQVIIAGIALPFLFLIGTSAGYQSKSTETEMRINNGLHEFNKTSSSISCRQHINELEKFYLHNTIIYPCGHTKFISNPDKNKIKL